MKSCHWNSKIIKFFIIILVFVTSFIFYSISEAEYTQYPYSMYNAFSNFYDPLFDWGSSRYLPTYNPSYYPYSSYNYQYPYIYSYASWSYPGNSQYYSPFYNNSYDLYNYQYPYNSYPALNFSNNSQYSFPSYNSRYNPYASPYIFDPLFGGTVPNPEFPAYPVLFNGSQVVLSSGLHVGPWGYGSL